MNFHQSFEKCSILTLDTSENNLKSLITLKSRLMVSNEWLEGAVYINYLVKLSASHKYCVWGFFVGGGWKFLKILMVSDKQFKRLLLLLIFIKLYFLNKPTWYFLLKEKLPQAFMQIGWMEDDFRNLTAKVWANLDNPIKKYDFFFSSKVSLILCMSPSQVALL